MNLENNEEIKLRKVLGLTDVLALVIGLTIGPGVLVLMGPGIGLTGKGVVLAFLIAGLANCINVIPIAQLCSAMPTSGAGYRYSSLLLGPRWGFLFELGVLMSKVIANGCQRNAARCAQKQFSLRRLVEAGHAFREAGLRDIEFTRGRPHTTVIHNRDEIAKLLQGHDDLASVMPSRSRPARYLSPNSCRD